mmetsp:Transcript_17764/g.29358  ORF Transcript_17764/g.29358 Transcript_17764/m.29358 type:complete len:206 (+) Transcript_17764:1396-2013(+)
MVLPIIVSFHVRVPIDWNSRSTFFLAQCIAHGCNGGHGKFRVHILRLDTDNAPGRCFRVRSRSLGCILLVDLIPRIQNQVNVLGNRKRLAISNHQVLWKGSRQDRNFLVIPGFVLAPQQVLVFRSNWEDVHLGIRKVVDNKQVLAKGSITILQILFRVALINNISKLLHRVRKDGSTVGFTGSLVLGELTVAEGVNNECFGSRHG